MKHTNDLSDWEICDARDALVSIASSELFLSVRGPPRQSGAAVIVCESGHGSRGVAWAAVARLLAPHARIFYYDRAGIGRSSKSELMRTATNMAAELANLLKTADIRPPYITLSHSYGGIIIRELLARLPIDSIVGMIFVDTNQEKSPETFKVPCATCEFFFGSIDCHEVAGFHNDHQLTVEEYSSIFSDEPHLDPNIDDSEAAHFLDSTKTLKEKWQFETQPLGRYPITAIMGNCARRDRLMLAKAHRQDIGTSEQRAEFEVCIELVEEHLEPLQREQLRLTQSGAARFVKAKKIGHEPQWTEPQLVADEVFAMLRSRK